MSLARHRASRREQALFMGKSTAIDEQVCLKELEQAGSKLKKI
jgi:hypothetical protein